MNRLVKWSCAIGLVSALVGCSGMDIQTDYDSQYSFGTIETYAWMPDGDKRKGDPRVYNDLVDQRVRKAVDSALAEKGLVKAEGGAEPDILVGYHAMLKDKISATTVNDYYGYQGVWSRRYWLQPGIPQTYVHEYQQGTLILDITKPKESRLVWRGSAQAELDRSASAEKREKMLNKAVRKILEPFPPD